MAYGRWRTRCPGGGRVDGLWRFRSFPKPSNPMARVIWGARCRSVSGRRGGGGRPNILHDNESLGNDWRQSAMKIPASTSSFLWCSSAVRPGGHLCWVTLKPNGPNTGSVLGARGRGGRVDGLRRGSLRLGRHQHPSRAYHPNTWDTEPDLYIFTHTSIYLSIYLSIHLSIYLYASIYLYIDMYIYIWVRRGIYMYMYIYICIYDIYIYIHKYICIFIDRNTFTYIYIYIYTYIYI